MELTSEVVNITKIKDGFFLGDEATASNLDVIIQFKITHMVNSAGSQIINAWESIGIKYLTLNWSEHSNQNLFDQKDEIANRIVNFIDDSSKNGEGLLVHSLRGQNRGCIVVIIYLIKKYRWTLAKCLEFLTNKKFDIEIPKYFLNQLSFFESRLSKLGLGPKSNTWMENGVEGDNEEMVIRNTYLNGLVNKNDTSNEIKLNMINKKIIWADTNNRNMLCSVNIGKELVYQKDIKPVLTHKKMKPTRSCLKKKLTSTSTEIKKSISNSNIGESLNISMDRKEMNIHSDNITNNLNKKISVINNVTSSINSNTMSNKPNFTDNLRLSSNELLKNYTNLYSSINPSSNVIDSNNNYNMSKSLNFENPKSKETKESLGMPNLSHLNLTGVSHIKPITTTASSNLNINNTRQNNFSVNQNNNPQTRSYSLGNDSKNNLNPSTNNLQNNNQIIYASKYKNVVHNSYNNIFIQSPGGLDNLINTPGYENSNNLQDNQINMNTNSIKIQGKNDYASASSTQYTNNQVKQGFNSTSYSNVSAPQATKLIKSGENQRLPQNNYFIGNHPSSNNSALGTNNLIEYKTMKVIDYTNPYNTKAGTSGYIPSQNIGNYQQNYSKNLNNNNSQTNKQGFTLNNYQPELNKKNNFNNNLQPSNTILNRQTVTNSKQGPIKIQNDYDRKPSTPDNIYDNNNNISTVKLGGSLKANQNNNQQFGTIKRSSSKSKEDPSDRPSTAPQKENDKKQNFSQQQSSLKRLPSPNLKSVGSNNLGSSHKNNSSLTLGNSLNFPKYRAPSPATINKHTTSTITLGSMKTAGGKPKWK